MFRTGNPTLKAETFGGLPRVRGNEAMTLTGTVNKTGISLVILMATAALVWNGLLPSQVLVPAMYASLAGGFVVALVTIFKKEWSPVTTPVYAVFEGVLLGVISLVFNHRYPGIAFNAAALTVGTLAVMLLAYRSGLIRATENVKLGIVAATGAIGLVYLTSMVVGLFGGRVPFIHESGLIGIGFSIVVVTVAALNLVLDFDFIERGAEVGAPKYMEWYGAFGLLVTLVWLYLEILRLLAKLQDRKR
jgi:uncharacterized YccA/Bax inhibitor family protein